MFNPRRPALVLAPMEGVTDAPMRALLGESGAFSYAVSEFLRVSQSVPSRAVFDRHIPELKQGAYTRSGLAVQVQLLGGHAGRMAEAAVVAVETGATAIDINFGCPAPTVNRHDGGATLLKYPERIQEIVAAIRSAVPATVPVSAKLRLGWDQVEAIFENAERAARGGASWITIHARTKMAGYRPPVYWKLIGQVRQRLDIPVIANGDIWTLADFRRCQDETGCQQFMIGRGSLANPRLPLQIAHELGLIAEPREVKPVDWSDQLRRLIYWGSQFPNKSEHHLLCRCKQWLSMAAKFGDFSQFEQVKRVTSLAELLEQLSPWSRSTAEEESPPIPQRTTPPRATRVNGSCC